MDKPIPEAVTALQLMALIDWHGKDGTRKGELTTAALLELHQARTLTAAQQQGQAVAVVGPGGYPNWLLSWLESEAYRTLPQGTKLYTAPPSAPVGVDEAMVDRAGQALYGTDWGSFERWEADQLRRKVRAVLTAALAQQPAAVDGAWLSKARSLYDRCSVFPETNPDGMTALLELRNHVYSILATQHQEPTT